MRIKPPAIEWCTNPQGSNGWHDDRAGVISASKFHLFMEKLKTGPNAGGYKAEAVKYAYELALERIIGGCLDDTKYRTEHASRGNELEPEARAAHEDMAGCIVYEVGFIRTLDRKFGASLDGVIRPGGTAEYKAFTDPVKVMDALVRGMDDEVKAQAQGGLWLSDSDWCHYGLYLPGLKKIARDISIIEIERDEEYIERLDHEARLFDNLVVEFMNQVLESRQAPLKYPARTAVKKPQQQPEPELELHFNF